MRATIFAVLAAVALLAAPLVVADGEGRERGRETAEAARQNHAAPEDRGDHVRGEVDENETEGNDTEGNDTRPGPRGRGAEAREAGHARAEARHAALAAFHASMAGLHGQWLENATQVREACRAEHLDKENATGEEVRAWAHCIRDGYKDLRTSFLEARRTLVDDLRAALRALRVDG